MEKLDTVVLAATRILAVAAVALQLKARYL